MPFDLIRVCVFGRYDPEWFSQVKIQGLKKYEAAGFDFHFHETDEDLGRILVSVRPQVLVSFGNARDYPQLWAAPLEVRRRWLNFQDPAVEPTAVANRIIAAFITNATTDRFPDQPLVSVFTPTYLTGAKIQRPFESLRAQTYRNWEWVVYDDSPDDGETFEQMRALCQQDHRIAAYRADRPSGCIGDVKRRACGLARGAILVELDHDDELAPRALAHVVEAYRTFPDAGFFYTDCAEVYENGQNATYGEGWGLSFGSYRPERHNGHEYMVANYPDVNSKTIRHIVGVPNHLRAWTRKAYLDAGGHNPDIHVCDDYELIIRTFLTTRMVHIQRLGYIQYFNTSSTGNTHKHRNTEIQRLVRYFRRHYNAAIHERFVELGVDDYIWREGGGMDWAAPDPTPTPIANYQLA